MYKITWWRRGRIRLTLYVRGGPENRTTGGARPPSSAGELPVGPEPADDVVGGSRASVCTPAWLVGASAETFAPAIISCGSRYNQL